MTKTQIIDALTLIEDLDPYRIQIEVKNILLRNERDEHERKMAKHYHNLGWKHDREKCYTCAQHICVCEKCREIKLDLE